MDSAVGDRVNQVPDLAAAVPHRGQGRGDKVLIGIGYDVGELLACFQHLVGHHGTGQCDQVPAGYDPYILTDEIFYIKARHGAVVIIAP